MSTLLASLASVPPITATSCKTGMSVTKRSSPPSEKR
jgi:hypothetical protein